MTTRYATHPHGDRIIVSDAGVEILKILSGDKRFAKAIEEMVRMANTGAKMQWTSVNERMPVQDGHTGHVLVARYVGYDPMFGDRDVTMGYLAKSGWCDDHGSIQKDGEVITHWMPFPEPPNGGKE